MVNGLLANVMGDDFFSLAREDRDAWAAIRGYVYQVDTTIVRWLTLQPDEALELECGEDIDLIAPKIAGGGGSPEGSSVRTLEQIKCMDRSFTLRSQCSRDALGSFAEHIRQNPTQSLRFRFVTTAIPGDEKDPSPMIFTPGVLLWEHIRTNQIGEINHAKAISSIAAFLRGMAPSEKSKNGWNHLLSFARDERLFTNFISRFEWSFGEVGSQNVVRQIESILISQGRAGDRPAATRQHAQLFTFVMRFLAKPKSETRRRIDLRDLDHCLRSGTISPLDTKILMALTDLKLTLTNELFELRKNLDSIKQDTEVIKDQITNNIGDDRLQLRPVVDEASVQQSFMAVSAALLSWPSKIGGTWIERQELAGLEAAIDDPDSNCTVLLGPPGSGKSSILAYLGRRLQERDAVLLALKTDQLPNNIETLKDLDEYVGAEPSLFAAIEAIAAKKPVVLLIDQLDALAALMDQKTNRLSVILQAANQLKSLTNVKLLISCREFDFRYDARFASLNAKELHLNDLAWEPVEKLLKDFGVDPTGWPAEMREMLCNPQHLSVFVANFSDEHVVFDSYQSMLEAMYTKRVVNAKGFSSATNEACEQIASAMSDAEELWIPRISMDQSFPQEVDRLVSAGMLKEEGRKIGFRHQTLFDYVRTRAFCNGLQSLAAYVIDRQDAIFVRSILWASMFSLRSSASKRYRTEMAILWETASLRKHIRLMLIDFLGQVSDPDDQEAQWLFSALDQDVLRARILGSIVGNAAWFVRLGSRLPSLMSGSDPLISWQLTRILDAALSSFNRESVFKLISAHWSDPRHDEQVLQTLRRLIEWDEQSTSLVENILARQSVDSYVVVALADLASKAGAGFGARMVAASLKGSFDRAYKQVQGEEHSEQTNTTDLAAESEVDQVVQALFQDRKDLAPFRELIENSDWYGLEDIASAESAQFVSNVWPILVKVFAEFAQPERSHSNEYRDIQGIEIDAEMGPDKRHLLESMKVAIRSWADHSPDAFLDFAKRAVSSDLLPLHRLLAVGYTRLAVSRPDAVLDYLMQDDRRLALGSYADRHKDSVALIATVSGHLEARAVEGLVQKVWQFQMYHDFPVDNVHRRRQRHRWNREHRLRLLRAFPPDRLTVERKTARDKEEIALPGTRDVEIKLEGGIIGSPLSAEQMAKATNQDILNLFNELGKGKSDLHPRSFMRGGMFQASQAFAQFAKQQPIRAIQIIECLEAPAQEPPAAHALMALADCENGDPHLTVDLIVGLAARGFSSTNFRDAAAWALQRLAVRCQGLQEPVCGLLKSWLTPAADQPETASEKVAPRNASRQPHSILWGLGGGGTLPHGNYPILAALGLGYRSRMPPNVQGWLDILSLHLKVREHESVWAALMRDLWILQFASRTTQAIEFLHELLGLHPAVFASPIGTVFLARSHHWLPGSFLQKALRSIEKSSWPWSAQAVGEMSMLRIACYPDDDYSLSIVKNAVGAHKHGDDSSLDLLRVGIAYTCGHLWNQPKFRRVTHKFLIELARSADGYLPGAIMDVFRTSSNIAPDDETKELLDVLVANPEIIKHGGRSFLLARLKELLSAGFDVNRVANATWALVSAIGPSVGDVRTAWAGDAGGLIQMSVALQRYKTTRSMALDIFEALMEAGAHEADQMLRDLDRRISTPK